MPPYPAKAKSVIFLFMGKAGPATLTPSDPKPEVNRLEGQLLPPSFLKKDVSWHKLTPESPS